MPEPVEHIDATEQTPSAGPGPDSGSAQPVPASRRRRFYLSPKQRTWLALIVIAIMAVGAFYAPPEGDSDNVMGDPAYVPTIVATDLVASTQLNHHLVYHGLQYTIIDARIARKFSDDRKATGNYVLRVDVFVKNVSQNVIGVDYASQIRLLDGHGGAIMTEFISIKPTSVPGSTQTGSFDFPLEQPAPLSSFSLQLADGVVVPL